MMLKRDECDKDPGFESEPLLYQNNIFLPDSLTSLIKGAANFASSILLAKWPVYFPRITKKPFNLQGVNSEWVSCSSFFFWQWRMLSIKKTLPSLPSFCKQRWESGKNSHHFLQDSSVFPFLWQLIIFNNLKPFAFRLLIVNSNETKFDGWLDASNH